MRDCADMHLFGADGLMKRFNSPLEVIEYFYPIRLEFYAKRKAYLLDKLREEVKRLRNQHRFNQEVFLPHFFPFGFLPLVPVPLFIRLQVVKGTLKVINKKKDAVLAELEAKKYDKHNGSYDFLLSMPLWNLTEERLIKFAQDKEAKEKV